MRRYELNERCFNIAWDSINENGKRFIESRMGIKENLYCSLISWISSYIKGKKWYIEINENSCIVKNNISALQDILKLDTGICIKKETCEEIINFINGGVQ